MKQIGNWVFGSFFRTIGRLLVFILLGIIIANIIDFGSLKDSFSITDLFFDKLDALTLTQDVEVFDSKVIDITNTDLTSEILYKRKFITSNTNQQQYYAWNISGYNYEDQINYIEIPIMFSWTNNATNVTTNSIEFCDRWKWRTVDSNNQVLEWGCEHVYYYNIDDKEINPNNAPSGLQFGFYAHNTDGGYSMCQIQDNYLVCPTRQRTIDFIGMLYDFRNSGSAQINMYVSLGTVWNRYQAQSVTSAINSQTQQQQQQHNETQSYLEDSNTTQAENEATDFFEDFDAPDIGGLGAIITAPLNTIRSLLNSSCTNLVLPLPFVNENLTLPCMNTIYTQHFGAFFTIYQTIVLALIAYRCIRSIFFDIHGFTNPNDDRIEVMDL